MGKKFGLEFMDRFTSWQVKAFAKRLGRQNPCWVGTSPIRFN